MSYTDPLNSCVREVAEDARRTHLETARQLENLFLRYWKSEEFAKVSTIVWDVTPSRLEHHIFLDSHVRFFQCMFIKLIIILEIISFLFIVQLCLCRMNFLNYFCKEISLS